MCSLTRIAPCVGPFAPTANSTDTLQGIDTLIFSKLELASAEEGTQEQSEMAHTSFLFYSILRRPY